MRYAGWASDRLRTRMSVFDRFFSARDDENLKVEQQNWKTHDLMVLNFYCPYATISI